MELFSLPSTAEIYSMLQKDEIVTESISRTEKEAPKICPLAGFFWAERGRAPYLKAIIVLDAGRLAESKREGSCVFSCLARI